MFLEKWYLKGSLAHVTVSFWACFLNCSSKISTIPSRQLKLFIQFIVTSKKTLQTTAINIQPKSHATLSI